MCVCMVSVCVHGECVCAWCVCAGVCMVSVCVHGVCEGSVREGQMVQVIQYSNILIAGQCGIPKQRVNFCFGLPLSIYSYM